MSEQLRQDQFAAAVLAAWRAKITTQRQNTKAGVVRVYWVLTLKHPIHPAWRKRITRQSIEQAVSEALRVIETAAQGATEQERSVEAWYKAEERHAAAAWRWLEKAGRFQHGWRLMKRNRYFERDFV